MAMLISETLSKELLKELQDMSPGTIIRLQENEIIRLLQTPERWPDTVVYVDGKYHYVPHTNYFFGSVDCEWIVPGTTP